MASEYVEFATKSDRARHRNKSRIAQDVRARGYNRQARGRTVRPTRELRPSHELGRLAAQERRAQTVCPVCGELTRRDDGFCLDCQVYKAGWLAAEQDGETL